MIIVTWFSQSFSHKNGCHGALGCHTCAQALTWLAHSVEPHHEMSVVWRVEVDIGQHSVTSEGDFVHGWQEEQAAPWPESRSHLRTGAAER